MTTKKMYESTPQIRAVVLCGVFDIILPKTVKYAVQRGFYSFTILIYYFCSYSSLSFTSIVRATRRFQ